MVDYTDYAIDLAFIPDLVRDDAALLLEPDGPIKYDRQVDLVHRAMSRLRTAQPELSSLSDDDLYGLVAHALAERNG